MTVIVAVTTPSGSYIGADSLSSFSYGLCNTSASPKIARFGNLLVGFAGSWRGGQRVLEQLAVVHSPTLATVLGLEWDESDLTLLVVEGRRIYEVNPDRGVIEANDQDGIAYAAIGSGAAVAMGAMCFAGSSLSGSSIKRVLGAAAEHTTSVRGPYEVIEM